MSPVNKPSNADDDQTFAALNLLADASRHRPKTEDEALQNITDGMLRLKNSNIKSGDAIGLLVRESITNNPGLSRETKARLIDEIRGKIIGERKALRQRLDSNTHELELKRRQIVALEEMQELLSQPLVLQKPEGSKFHQARQAFRDGEIIFPLVEPDAKQNEISDCLDDDYQIFLIEHNWASAFNGATDFDAGEVILPYDLCCFEFRISGRHVLLCMHKRIDGEGLDATAISLIKTSVGWAMPWLHEMVGGEIRPATLKTVVTPSSVGDAAIRFNPLVEFMANQVRAICIALDAEVATTEVVRAPHKLNKARERRGQLPIFDHHVVTLSRKPRAAALPADDGGEHVGTRRRLHFRRGHWRHYATHKTWINWMLVGDPDLGFIEKEYKL